MNTERLFDFLDRLSKEAQSIGISQQLDQMSSHCANMVSQPQQPAHQTNFSSVLDTLEESLSQSWFSKMTPLEDEILTSIELGSLRNAELIHTIRKTLSENSVLPAILQKTVVRYTETIKAALQKAQTTRNGLKDLGFEGDKLSSGIGEVAMRIPRGLIDENFEGFISDAKFLNDLMATTSEIVLGEPTPLKLRSIASSDYAIYLEMLPEVVGFTVLAIERVMNGYKTLLEMKVLKQQLSDRHLPEDISKLIQEQIDERIKEVARKGVEEAIAEWKPKAKTGRLNELKILAGKRLGELTRKIESGYELDGRVGYEELSDEDEGSAEQNKLKEIDFNVRKQLQTIRSQVIEAERLKEIGFDGTTVEPKDESD